MGHRAHPRLEKEARRSGYACGKLKSFPAGPGFPAMEMERGPFKPGFGSGYGLLAGHNSRWLDKQGSGCPLVFIKFDKIRSFWVFWVFWGMRSECMGFGFLSEAQRRRAKGFFSIEKGTLVSGAKAA